MNAERLMFLSSVAAFLLTIFWVRSRMLREKYAVLWLGVATLLLVCGIFPRLIMSFADSSNLAYPSAVLFISLGAIYVYAFSVSVTLTGLHRRNNRLAQEIALLEQRVRELESQGQPREEDPAADGAP